MNSSLFKFDHDWWMLNKLKFSEENGSQKEQIILSFQKWLLNLLNFTLLSEKFLNCQHTIVHNYKLIFC